MAGQAQTRANGAAPDAATTRTGKIQKGKREAGEGHPGYSRSKIHYPCAVHRKGTDARHREAAREGCTRVEILRGSLSVTRLGGDPLRQVRLFGNESHRAEVGEHDI